MHPEDKLVDREIPDLFRYCKPQTEQSLRILSNIPEQGHRKKMLCLSSCIIVPSPIFCQCTIKKPVWHSHQSIQGLNRGDSLWKAGTCLGYLSALLLDAMPLCSTQPNQSHRAALDPHNASEMPCFLLSLECSNTNLDHSLLLLQPFPGLLLTHFLGVSLDITFLSCSLD